MNIREKLSRGFKAPETFIRFCINILHACYDIFDNMSIIKNISNPESTLNKKSNTVYYHAVKASVSMGEALQHKYLVQKTQQTL